MGSAMLGGWLKNSYEPGSIFVVDPSPPSEVANMLRANHVTCLDTAEKCPAVDILILAVKPQILDNVLPMVIPMIGADTVAVSVAAGKTIESMTNVFGQMACVRVMPNTPALVGQAMSVGYANSDVTETQLSRIDLLFQAIGKVAWVDEERLIDAVTAVSGSGPAYVFHLAECMANAGATIGLDRELALVMAKQTILGAATLMDHVDESPSKLRENVTSPNGTTAAALEILMTEQRMQELIQEAIYAANIRSQELSG